MCILADKVKKNNGKYIFDYRSSYTYSGHWHSDRCERKTQIRQKKENMDNEKKGMKIRIPDEEKTVIPNMVQEEKHKIIRLYQSPRVEGVWICRCCETENRITDFHCSVCGNYK